MTSDNEASTTPRILIVGAGIFGTSTAYHLALSHPDPSSITILDRTAYPPHHAASTDINKIVRADYTDPFYMELAYEALEAWKSGPIYSPYFHESGWIMLSNSGSDLADRIRQNLRARGSDGTSDVGIDGELREKWVGLLAGTEFDGIEKGYWNPQAGWADADKAVERMIGEAVGKGVKYVVGDVEELVLGKTGVTGVKTKGGEIYEADKVVLATGAWTSQILSPLEDLLDIKENDRVEKQVTAAGVCVAHYQLSDEEFEALKDIPVVIYGDRGEILPPPASTKLLKFTNARSFTNTVPTASGHRISVPPSEPQTEVTRELQRETIDRMVKTTIPKYVDRPIDYWRLCWDAITPSQDQLIARHPDPRLSNLHFAVGGSFHSWKFLPIIGKYVANVLNGVSNGEEKDRRWKWKTGRFEGRGAHEKVVPRRELGELQGRS